MNIGLGRPGAFNAWQFFVDFDEGCLHLALLCAAHLIENIYKKSLRQCGGMCSLGVSSTVEVRVHSTPLKVTSDSVRSTSGAGSNVSACMYFRFCPRLHSCVYVPCVYIGWVLYIRITPTALSTFKCLSCFLCMAVFRGPLHMQSFNVDKGFFKGVEVRAYF